MSESIKINALTSSGVAESAHHFRTKDEQSEVLTPPTQSTYDEQPISKNLIETQFGVILEQFDHNFRNFRKIPNPNPHSHPHPNPQYSLPNPNSKFPIPNP